MRTIALAALVSIASLPAAVLGYEPKVNYQLECQGCHLADGSGEAGRTPSLRGTLIPLSMRPEGRDFIVRVPGVAQSPLSDADTAALLNWMVRNLADGKVPDSFRNYTAIEVGALRRHPLAQVAAVRQELIK